MVSLGGDGSVEKSLIKRGERASVLKVTLASCSSLFLDLDPGFFFSSGGFISGC